MIYNIKNLTSLLSTQRKLPVIADFLVAMMKEGYNRGVLIETIYHYYENNDNDDDDEYKDLLDDVIAAMEGQCHHSYLLHPSQFR